MIIKTRKLPPTQNDSARMRATSDTGASLTIPYPHGADDPGEHVALALARAVFPNAAYSVERRGDNRWEMRVYV